MFVSFIGWHICTNTYPTGIDLTQYDKMIVGTQFKCYTDTGGHINMYNDNNLTIYTAIGICSPVLFVILSITFCCMFYDFNHLGKLRRRRKYTAVTTN